jgi:hypothetical protein
MNYAKLLFVLIAILALQFQYANAKFNLGKIFDFYSKKIQHRSNYTFSYQNCGPASDPVKIDALSVLPQPIHFPGVLTINAAGTLMTNITAPLTVCIYNKFQTIHLITYILRSHSFDSNESNHLKGLCGHTIVNRNPRKLKINI